MKRPSTSPSTNPTSAAPPGHLSRQGPPALRWALFEAAQCARRPASPDRDVLPRGRGPPRREPRVPVGRAQAAQAQLPHAARARRGGTAARMTTGLCALPSLTPMRRGRLPARSCRHDRVDGLDRPSGRNASPSGITPSTIMSPTRNQPGSWTEIRLGARAHTTRAPTAPTHHPTNRRSTIEPSPALDAGSLHRVRRSFGLADSESGTAAIRPAWATMGKPGRSTTDSRFDPIVCSQAASNRSDAGARIPRNAGLAKNSAGFTRRSDSRSCRVERRPAFICRATTCQRSRGV